MEATDPNVIAQFIDALLNADPDAVAGGAIAIFWIRGFEWLKKSIAGKNGRWWGILRTALSVAAMHRHTPQNGPSKVATKE